MTNELKDRDAWIAEHVMGYRWWFDVMSTEALLLPPDAKWPEQKGFKLQDSKPPLCTDETDLSCFRPTTSPADAMRVLEKCFKHSVLPICCGVKFGGYYCVEFSTLECIANAPVFDTFELAACNLARKLFEK